MSETANTVMCNDCGGVFPFNGGHRCSVVLVTPPEPTVELVGAVPMCPQCGDWPREVVLHDHDDVGVRWWTYASACTSCLGRVADAAPPGRQPPEPTVGTLEHILYVAPENTEGLKRAGWLALGYAIDQARAALRAASGPEDEIRVGPDPDDFKHGGPEFEAAIRSAVLGAGDHGQEKSHGQEKPRASGAAAPPEREVLLEYVFGANAKARFARDLDAYVDAKLGGTNVGRTLGGDVVGGGAVVSDRDADATCVAAPPAGPGADWVIERRFPSEAEARERAATLPDDWAWTVRALATVPAGPGEPTLRQAAEQLVGRCEELAVCLRDPEANAYDGATTRTLWRQAITELRAALAGAASPSQKGQSDV